uniref:Uncharacterized protein n=1 Tax=Dulem virus 262 TaxID=3145739 RepID=A0AAU8AWX8_9VIRU
MQCFIRFKYSHHPFYYGVWEWSYASVHRRICDLLKSGADIKSINVFGDSNKYACR